MLGRRVRADEALAWGLVHQVVPRPDTLAAATALARRLATQPAQPFAALKRSVQRGLEAGWDVALREETREFATLLDRRLSASEAVPSWADLAGL